MVYASARVVVEALSSTEEKNIWRCDGDNYGTTFSIHDFDNTRLHVYKIKDSNLMLPNSKY